MLSAVTPALERYDMADAARALYTFFWSEFCDWFVEISKPALRAGGADGERARQTLHYLLEGTLRALHPFMPFITEEIWQKMPGAGESVMVSAWPEPVASWRDDAAEQQMGTLMEVVVAARKLRANQNVPTAQAADITVATPSQAARQVIEANRTAILMLARGNSVVLTAEMGQQTGMAEVIHCFGEPASVSIAVKSSEQEMKAQRARLEKELAHLGEEEQGLSTKLRNTEFLSRAPRQVVEKVESRYREVTERKRVLEEQLLGIDTALGERKP
jgi:valyl-tRNA synthetase